MLKKVTILAILIALMAASFPMSGVLAKGEQASKLEAQWKELTTSFKTQSVTHGRIDKSVETWLRTDKKASASDKAQVERRLAMCNSAFAAARSLVVTHAGFDSNGKVIEVAAAKKTVKNLAHYLQQHAGSVKNLKEDIK